VDVAKPGVGGIGDTHVLGRFLRDVLKLNAAQRNFRIFGPDETAVERPGGGVRGDQPAVGRRDHRQR
jgi:phosphoketolase